MIAIRRRPSGDDVGSVAPRCAGTPPSYWDGDDDSTTTDGDGGDPSRLARMTGNSRRRRCLAAFEVGVIFDYGDGRVARYAAAAPPPAVAGDAGAGDGGEVVVGDDALAYRPIPPSDCVPPSDDRTLRLQQTVNSLVNVRRIVGAYENYSVTLGRYAVW